MSDVPEAFNMSDIWNWPKEFLTNVINIYKSEKYLWKIKSKEYTADTDFLKTISFFIICDLTKHSITVHA
jgi:hypothetical protein